MFNFVRALAFACALLLPTLAFAQAELRSGGKGASTPLPVTASSIDANTNALDVFVAGGGTSGTEYTEDAAAVANPLGGVQILVRDDTPGTLTSDDGDNVARRGTDYGAAFTQILDSSGNFIDTFGGGTQYTEGDTDSTITGTAAMMEVAADTLQPVQGTVADGLLVNLGTNNDVSITGTVTVDLDTNNDVVASGVAAENAAVSGNPVLISGRYDATPRTLDDGDTGAIALGPAGSVIIRSNAANIALSDNISNTANLETDEGGSFVGTAPFMYAFDGSTWDRVRGDSTDGLLVNLGTNNDVVVSATNLDVQIGGSDTVQVQSNSANLATQATLATIDTDTGDIVTSVQLIDNPVQVLGTDTYTEATDSAFLIGGVRSDTLAAKGNIDNEIVPFQFSAAGALYVNVAEGGGQAEDALAASGDAGTPGFYVHDPTPVAATPSGVGDYSWAAVDGFQSQYVTLTDAAGAAVDADALAVIGSGVLATSLRVNIATDDPVNDAAVELAAAITANELAVTYGSGTFIVGDGAGALNVICDSGCAGGTQYAEDDPHGTGNTGTLALVVRNDAGTALAADGDNIPLMVNSAGALYVTGGGGGTEPTDDTTTHATGSSVGTGIMAVATPTDGSVDANDFGHLGMSTDRRLHTDTQIVGQDAALDVSGATVTVSATNLDVQIGGSDTLTVAAHDVTNAGTFAIQVSDTSFAVADGNALGEGVLMQGDDGTDRKNVNVDATTGDVQVDVTNTVTVSATDLDVQIGGSDSLTIGTFPDNEPFNLAQIGGTAVVSGPCERELPLFVEINQTTNTQIVTGTASERIYICSFHVTVAAAEDIALVSGTGTVCATSPAGLEGFGGATAATGWQFAANGGIMMNYNKMAHGRTDTDADNVCLFQSGSGQVGGGFSYVSL